MKRSKRKTKDEKFNLTVLALQKYLKEKGHHMGFLEWKRVAVQNNHKAKNQFHNVTIKGVALMENYDKHGIREEIPVNFTYTQDISMAFDFKDEG